MFVLWGTAEMSDLVRGALIAIPKHQYESSEALGMSRAQTYWYIIIPQTVRRLIPLSINLITRMIKTTSLVLMIGVVEVLKVTSKRNGSDCYGRADPDCRPSGKKLRWQDQCSG